MDAKLEETRKKWELYRKKREEEEEERKRRKEKEDTPPEPDKREPVFLSDSLSGFSFGHAIHRPDRPDRPVAMTTEKRADSITSSESESNRDDEKRTQKVRERDERTRTADLEYESLLKSARKLTTFLPSSRVGLFVPSVFSTKKQHSTSLSSLSSTSVVPRPQHSHVEPPPSSAANSDDEEVVDLDSLVDFDVNDADNIEHQRRIEKQLTQERAASQSTADNVLERTVRYDERTRRHATISSKRVSISFSHEPNDVPHPSRNMRSSEHHKSHHYYDASMHHRTKYSIKPDINFRNTSSALTYSPPHRSSSISSSTRSKQFTQRSAMQGTAFFITENNVNLPLGAAPVLRETFSRRFTVLPTHPMPREKTALYHLDSLLTTSKSRHQSLSGKTKQSTHHSRAQNSNHVRIGASTRGTESRTHSSRATSVTRAWRE